MNRGVLRPRRCHGDSRVGAIINTHCCDAVQAGKWLRDSRQQSVVRNNIFGSKLDFIGKVKERTGEETSTTGWRGAEEEATATSAGGNGGGRKGPDGRNWEVIKYFEVVSDFERGDRNESIGIFK
ncbi:hypothetical protein GWI33_012860 [Rhynchophorus ferrugineus]|uniref:Uncharacterized protein n=1 Tax=Rhynchophorus ferrugineus TaxID=354439 RepID=A0A834I9C9_RHYFE|nr:hypothetical protein GWI33_012860 [Rhynchophorus ferrugineus]